MDSKVTLAEIKYYYLSTTFEVCRKGLLMIMMNMFHEY